MENPARETIRGRLSQVKAFLAQEFPPRLSESDTKANFIEPIITALGWDGIGVVTREYYVKNSQEFIDYVMSGLDGKRLLAIEAKPLQTDLTEKHAAQLIQYCAVEGIEWAALTNGRELQFFNTFLKPDLAAKRVLRLDLLAFNADDEFDALFAQLWQLSRESMTTPTGVRNWLLQRRMDAAIREHVQNTASPTIKQLRRALIEAEISASPQDIAQWFRTHLMPAIPTITPTGSLSSGHAQPKPIPKPSSAATFADDRMHLLTPVRGRNRAEVRKVLEDLLGEGMYVFGDRTGGRKHLKPGDRIAFFETGVGVVAEAEVTSTPERRILPQVRDPEKYPWAFSVTNVRLFFDAPVVLSAELRSRLDACQGRDCSEKWAWLVQGTHRVTAHDFALLVGGTPQANSPSAA